MGHSSVVVTERYAHLRPDLFGEADYELLDVDLMKPPAKVLPLDPEAGKGACSYVEATQAASGAAGDVVNAKEINACAISSVG